ncbi:MAG: ROK family protein [Acidobacteria bacterium]|nr:ROK family protein [Acidobacteriota bacterium]
MRIGVDLGGTKIEIAALDDHGDVRFRRRVATPRGDYAGTIRAIAGLVEEAEGTAGAGTVGVGIPGAIAPATGLVKNANSTWLNGRPFHQDLSEALAREIRIANDANCFALSEALDGSGAGARVVFGVIVGTGTGAGVVVDGNVLVGPNAIAGEWGHNPMPWPEPAEWPGPRCYCGRTGCIETFLSGPGLSREYVGRGGPSTASHLEVAELEARAGQGDGAAVAALSTYERRMARALASVINVLDPDVIVLGGGLSNISRLYDNVPRLWRPFVFSDEVRTRLLCAREGDSSGVRGAAWLWGGPGGIQPR